MLPGTGSLQRPSWVVGVHARRLKHGAVVLRLLYRVLLMRGVMGWVVRWGLGMGLQVLVDCRDSSCCKGVLGWVHSGSVVWTVEVQDEARGLVRGWLWLVD